MLDYEIAGLGSRALAALVDSLILVGTLVATGLLAFAVQAQFPSAPVLAVMVALQFLLIWGYYTLFEGLREGQTPGKRRMGIRVIQVTGHGITLRESAIRNLLRIADFLPPPYLLGALMVALHPRARRLGDLAAGTVVVRDRPVEAGASMEIDGAESDSAPVLTDPEYQLLREFSARAAALDTAVRDRLTASLAARLTPRVPARHQGDAEFLQTLLADESARRRGRFAVRGHPASRGPDRRSGTVTAARLVARKDSRWRTFEAMAARATQHGLHSLGTDELPDFAARYREVASDLARARTYRADPMVRSRLERTVAAGHNLLYRAERRNWRDLWAFVAHGAPAPVAIRAGSVVTGDLAC